MVSIIIFEFRQMLAFLGRSAVAKPRAVLNLVDTRYYTQTRLPGECYWTRSSPKHGYIQKGVAIWELGRTRDTVHIKP